MKFGGSGTLSVGAGESAGARVRFVDPAHSDLYGNITTFGESRLLGVSNRFNHEAEQYG